MKKMAALALSASMIVSACPMGAFAEEAAGLPGVEGYYGFSLAMDEMSVNADYSMQVDKNGTGAISVNMSIAEGEEEPVEVSLPDYVITTNDSVILNVGSIVSLVEALSGEENTYGPLLEMVGITGDYVEIPMPDLSKIVMDQPAAIAAPSEEMLQALMGAAVPFMPEVNEAGEMIITVNNENLLESASILDGVIAQFKDEILGMTSAGEADEERTLDIKPAFAQYINAAAEGLAAAIPGTTVEDAEEMIGQIVDAFVGEFLANSSVSLSVAGIDVDEATIDSISIHDALAEAMGEQEFEAVVALKEDGLNAAVTVDGEPIVLDVKATEDGIEGTLGDGENVYVTATGSMTETGCAYSVAAGEQELLSGEVEMEEDGLSGYVAITDTVGIGYAFTAEELENGFSGTGAVSVSAEDMDVTFSGYMTMESTDGEMLIEIPEATSALDIVKSVAYLYGMSMAQEAE